MYNVIADIGQIVSTSTDSGILSFLVQKTDTFKHIVGLNFDLENHKLDFLLLKSSEKKLSDTILKEYLYIGNEKANREQFSPTTENLTYLISQSLPNLAKKLNDDLALTKLLKEVIKQFFRFSEKPEDSKYGKILDDKFIDELRIQYKDEKEKVKENVKEYVKNLKESIGKHLGIKTREALFTVLINSQPVAYFPEYQKFLINLNVKENFSQSKKGVCSICGRENTVTSNTKRFVMKFYMTEKINFASYFDKKNFYKAVTLCEACYKNYLIGENWIAQNLNTRLGGFNLYIIPQLIFSSKNGYDLIEELKNIPKNFNDIKNVKRLQEIEKDSIRKNKVQQSLLKNPFVWNFLFYKKTNSAFKILTMIKDVPPSRILTLLRMEAEVEKIRQKLLPEWITFDLDQIYWLIPLKINKEKKLLEFKKILHIYYNIISGIPLNRNALYGFYKTLAHIHHFESYASYQISKSIQNDLPIIKTNIKKNDFALTRDTLKWNLFLLFLKKLNLINGGNFMFDQAIEDFYPEGMKEFMQEMGYTKEQQGLALLGYAIGVVAYAQVQANLKNKPVLNKINYQGMSDEKVMRLFNEIFEKIRQYHKKIGYAERWWAAGKKLYESGDRNALTADERVFYLLSGYALNTIHSKVVKENNGDQDNSFSGGQHE